MLNTIILQDQVLGDNFGFILQFPYDINGWEILLTLKSCKNVTDAYADVKVAINPTGVTPDVNGLYNVTLATTAAQTAALSAKSYWFDIVTKDTSGNVAHVISPESQVSFIQSVTQSE